MSSGDRGLPLDHPDHPNPRGRQFGDPDHIDPGEAGQRSWHAKRRQILEDLGIDVDKLDERLSADERVALGDVDKLDAEREGEA